MVKYKFIFLSLQISSYLRCVHCHLRGTVHMDALPKQLIIAIILDSDCSIVKAHQNVINPHLMDL